MTTRVCVKKPIPTDIVASVRPSALTPRRIEREFLGLLEAGAEILPAGKARRRPSRLLSLGYTPKYKVELFGNRFYLTNVRQNPDLRFFIAYVVPPRAVARDGTPKGKLKIYPRIFYKDISLIWRAATHFVSSDYDFWIGKGDTSDVVIDGEDMVVSAESTTDLPFEMQTALEDLNHKIRSIRRDRAVFGLVLRQAPDDRIGAYRDFIGPRRKAAADRRNLIHGGRRVAWFRRKNDPESLKFASGFEPDFAGGLLETAGSRSSLYGGNLRRFRILSKNRKIQYLFFAGPRHAWVIPPQAITTQLSTYGVRTVDVVADEEVFVPGYEYHFLDDSVDPPVFHTQIPPGFAGETSPHDDARADASAWLDRLPVIREFRKKLLSKHAGQRQRAANRD